MPKASKLRPTTVTHRRPAVNPELQRLIYRRDVLGLPGAIDRWLEANKLDAHSLDVFLRGYISLGDVHSDQVMCFVYVAKTVTPDNDTIFADPDMYSLHIRARVPLSANLGRAALRSPCAVLDRFEGDNSELRAPAWTTWTTYTINTPLEFRQPRGDVARLFSRMALWEENLSQPGLSEAMMKWACAAAVGTNALTHITVPQTPQGIPAAQNAAPRKPRRLSGVNVVHTLHFEDSDGEDLCDSVSPLAGRGKGKGKQEKGVLTF